MHQGISHCWFLQFIPSVMNCSVLYVWHSNHTSLSSLIKLSQMVSYTSLPWKWSCRMQDYELMMIILDVVPYRDPAFTMNFELQIIQLLYLEVFFRCWLLCSSSRKNVNKTTKFSDEPYLRWMIIIFELFSSGYTISVYSLSILSKS